MARKMKLLLMKKFLRIRCYCACLWRIGLIERTTAFRWEMDDFLGEYTTKNNRVLFSIQ